VANSAVFGQPNKCSQAIGSEQPSDHGGNPARDPSQPVGEYRPVPASIAVLG
jgi:hypothetical protein